MRSWILLAGFGISSLIIAIVGDLGRASVFKSSLRPGTQGEQPGVLFVVSSRRWQRIVLRAVGIALVACGGLFLLVAATTPQAPSRQPMSIAGAIGIALGACMIWGAHLRVHRRLAVTDDAIWVYRSLRTPVSVGIADLTRIREIPPGRYTNYGGMTARRAGMRAFRATGDMVGYAELMEHLRSRRPDLFPSPVPVEPAGHSAWDQQF